MFLVLVVPDDLVAECLEPGQYADVLEVGSEEEYEGVGVEPVVLVREALLAPVLEDQRQAVEPRVQQGQLEEEPRVVHVQDLVEEQFNVKNRTRLAFKLELYYVAE